MRSTLALFAIAALGASASAAEQPLGLVEKVDGERVVVHFEADPRVAPGTMLAIYGPGAVEKHPLTSEVIVERRLLVAKVQALGANGAELSARVLWIAPAPAPAVAVGDDVVPLPGEAAPNAPPVLSGPQPTVSCPAGSTLALNLPISDPDGDAVSYSWSLKGQPGRAGRLDALTTARPSVVWSAPALPGPVTAEVEARDSAGHLSSFTCEITVTTLDDPRKRDLVAFARLGADAERPLGSLARDAGGGWLGTAADGGKLVRVSPGWLGWSWVGGSDKSAPSGLAVASWRDDTLLLSRDGVAVLAANGAGKRTFGGFDRPSGLAAWDDGAVAVADQAGGGVLVFEPDGRFRARLGRAGDGEDDFQALVRVACGPDGQLAALDAGHRRIARFDRYGKRLPSWPLSADAALQAIDLAWHPRGLLVLLSSGAIQVYDAKGLSREALPPLADAGLIDEPGQPAALAVDGQGQVFATYPASGAIARYGEQGRVTGARAPKLRDRTLWAADGCGRLYSLSDDGNLETADAEGWVVARRGAIPRKHCAGIAAAADGAWIELLDKRAHAVVRISPAEEHPLSFGQEGKNNGQFDDPASIAVDDAGRTYVLDKGLYRVSVFDAKGSFAFAFGTYGKGASELREPKLIAVAPTGDACYVYDEYRYEVKKFALDQKAGSASHVTNAGGRGDGPGQIKSLVGLGCDRLDLLYLVDASREDVQALDFRGNSPVALCARKYGDLGVRSVAASALAPDGQLWLAGDGTLAGARWSAR